ncbi:MAG: hypothetical protein ACK4M1_01195 [Flavobacterium sp.]
MKFYAFLLSLFSLTVFSQNNGKDKIDQAILKYYEMDRENIHLHFNKTTYLSNETIWFKGYVIEKKESKLNFQTTNVFVRLVDDKNTEISNQLFFASNGTVIGQIKITESLPSGDYYIHTYTNYMNNFLENESTVQKIKIINIRDKTTQNTDIHNQPNVNFSFEGGKLLYQSDNTIGVSIKDCNGKGLKISNIEVKNSKDIVVNSFSTNQEGFGKFELKQTEDEDYRIIFTNQQEVIVKTLPKATYEGINLQVNNYAIEGKVSVKINTNDITFKKNKNKTYTILIQKNDYANYVDFNLDNTSKELFIDKSNLFEGITILRLLDDELNSISERVIYNHPSNTSKVQIITTEKRKDSIKIKASLKDRIGNFSISALPGKANSNFNSNNIFTNLTFKNYCEISDFDYSYYFGSFNKRKAYELDLMLLHVSESKYNWSSLLNQAPKPNYTFDMGLTISGKVNQNISNKENTKLRLFSINGIEEYTTLKDDNSFEFQNIMAIDSSVVYFSLIKKEEKLESVGIYSKLENVNKKFLKPITFPKFECQEVIFTKNPYDTNFEFPKLDGVHEFKEVDIIEAKKPKLERQREYGNSMAKGYKINDTEAGTFRDVLSFIGSHGYDTYTEGGQVVIRNRVSTSFMGSRTPVVFLDNVQIFDFTILLNMNLNDVDEIYINKRGYGMGNDGSNGSIRIYSKKIIANKTKPTQIKSKSLEIKNGFQPYFEFENPKYLSFNNEGFEKHGTIDWIPSIYTNEDGTFEFTIPYFEQKEVLLNIQGIDNKGQLYFENITIEVK